MRNILVASALVIASISTYAAQAPQVRSVSETDRREALRHYRLGQDALHSEHFDEAEREFQKAGTLDPMLELAPYGLGQVYMATKRFRPAIAAFEKCREVFHANAVVGAGDAMSYDRRIEDKIVSLEDQLRMYQSSPGRSSNSTGTRAYIQQLNDQITSMKEMRHRTGDGTQPTPAWISIALGGAYFRSDALADAEREYLAALAVDPKVGEAHNNLAVVYLETGRFQQAEAEVKAAEAAGVKVNPQLKEDIKNALRR